MGTQTTSDFVVDTIGHCFICMEKVPSQFPTTESGSGSSTSPICSMHYTSRYLKLKTRKVFQDEDLIPENLLHKVETSTLKVALCKECASWNAKLSSLVRQLEKVELEAVSYVQLIHDKLQRAGVNGKCDLSSKLVDHCSGMAGKLQIAEALRKETIHKCSRKINTSKPNIRLQKLSEGKILAVKAKLRHSTMTPKLQNNISPISNSVDLPIPEAEVNDFKLEQNDLEETGMGSCIDDYVGYVEDQNMDLEQNCSSPTTKNPSKVDLPVIKTIPRFKQRKYSKNLDTGKHECNICCKEFKTASGAYLHYQIDHLNIRYKCKICDQVFTVKSTLMAHQRSAHLKLGHTCKVCGKNFVKKESLKRHYQKCSSQSQVRI